MISCGSGHVKIEGSKTQIETELATLIRSLIEAEDQVLTEDEVMECVELAKLSDEALDAKIKSKIQELTPEQLLEAMADMVRDCGGRIDASH